ncbi:cytochrome-c peroxidase [Parasediminibacterium sp. JCM 36343]|uniref:cytochrome-c peroxidase n=1 Tax=Parasediminibacterium sp. JCM 36343 TaxID=3374279 RepID=UPI003979193D
MRLPLTILSLFMLMLAVISWVRKDAAIIGTPITFIVPKGWPQPINDFKKNPVTQEGFELGKKLFYDGRLSKDGNFACGSCHQQFAAFATYDHSFSHGYNNTQTTRNATALFNLAWQKEFMADGSIAHLAQQPIVPITAPNEMAENIDSIVRKLKKDTAYKKLFTKAFGNAKIDKERITKALTQFMLMLVSSNSKYDKVMRGEDKFILPEQLGYDIFKTKCVSCHAEPMFTDYTYRNIGLPLDIYLKDFGRMKVTGKKEDSLKFRVPSLRNVVYTAPYGHDGRFFGLMNVFQHYKGKISQGPTTDSLLRKSIPLSNYEIGQLTAFLYTLSDTSFIRDKRFAEPAMENEKPLFQHIH